MIEAFRENGLNTLEPTNEVSVARLETLISSLYHNLNKRLPTNQQVPVDSKAGLLLNWLLSAYTNDNSSIRVFSIKIALAIMCAGKLVDKLRCKSTMGESLISDRLFVNGFIGNIREKNSNENEIKKIKEQREET